MKEKLIFSATTATGICGTELGMNTLIDTPLWLDVIAGLGAFSGILTMLYGAVLSDQ